MLKITNLSVNADEKEILKNINLEIRMGETHVIMGQNGRGKSTLCKAILNHPAYKITSGKIEFCNEDITNKPTNEIAQKGIFLVEQNPTEISGVTNRELLRLAQTERGIKESIFEFGNKLNAACDELRIDKNFIHRNVNERMSGGEKKKNELLQLYVLKPKLILLDELDSGLDIDSLRDLASALVEYQKKTKASILIITHHINILEYIIPDKVHVLDNGKFTLEGDITLAQNIEKMGYSGTLNVSGEKVYE